MPMRNGAPVKRCLLIFVSLDVELAGVDAGSGGEVSCVTTVKRAADRECLVVILGE